MDPVLGTVFFFAGNYEPNHYAHCDGRVLSITENPPLYAVLGTTYGGDGKTTFALPTIAPLTPDGPHAIIAVRGMFPARQ